ncbi:MAG: hypothetical protein K5770_15735 [Lachnospiraceae bacterium]|nr:hypothetical protein [Lachnospiraceae bacterium]
MKELFKEHKNISSILFTATFIILVILLGALSFLELMDFYINDLPDTVEWTAELGSRFETDFASSFYRKPDFVGINGLMRNVLGEREMNRVIKLENGYLYQLSDPLDDETVMQSTESIIRTKDYFNERGIPFIFAIPPETSSKYDPQIPDGLYDYTNENLDKFASALRLGGVQLIDFRDELYSDGIDAYDMMYRTDHHWNTEMGFYAYLKFADVLEKELDCTIDPKVKDINNYTIETFPKWHLGSRGQRTGRFFGGIDDFDLITPNFETHLLNLDDESEGEYRGMLINTTSLREKDLNRVMHDINNRSTYDMVLEQSEGDYLNYDSFNDKKILVLTDSFGKAVCPFLDISFKQVKWDFGPVKSETVNEFEPDAVLMFYSLSTNYRFEYRLD